MLEVKPGGTYVDVTYGGGGHSKAILAEVGEEGRLFAFDRDRDAEQNIVADERLHFVKENFKFIDKELSGRGVAQVDGIIADLGVSSWQFDTPERGFSYRFDAPLDMRMNTTETTTAADLLNDTHPEHLLEIFSRYGEIPNAKKLVRILTTRRQVEKITGSFQLEQIISTCIPHNRRSKYLSQVYQALRIEVNKEMEALEALLLASIKLLKPGGRLVVIAYHSLEDRMVKRFVRSGNLDDRLVKDFYGNPITPWKLITRRAMQPDENEIEQNRRARSARLRAAERTDLIVE